MHTGSKLDGTVCKCMTCAAARHRKLEVRAWIERPAQMASIAEREAIAKFQREAAEQALVEIGREKSELLDTVLQTCNTTRIPQDQT